jgi:hypothetical protein
MHAVHAFETVLARPNPLPIVVADESSRAPLYRNYCFFGGPTKSVLRMPSNHEVIDTQSGGWTPSRQAWKASSPKPTAPRSW